MDPRSTYEVGRAAAARDVALEDRRIRTIRSRPGSWPLLRGWGSIGVLVWTEVTRLAWGGVAALVALFGASRPRDRPPACFLASRARHGDPEVSRPRPRSPERAVDRACAGRRRFPLRRPPLFRTILDVFGKASLFQLLNAAETPFGEQALAKALSGHRRSLARSTPPLRPRRGGRGVRSPGPTSSAGARAAVKELAAKLGFRERLSAVGHVVSSERPDPTPFVNWVEKARPTRAFGIVASPVVRPAGARRRVHGAGAMLGAAACDVGRRGARRAGLFLWVHRVKTATILAAASSKEGTLGRFADLFAVIEGYVRRRTSSAAGRPTCARTG